MSFPFHDGLDCNVSLGKNFLIRYPCIVEYFCVISFRNASVLLSRLLIDVRLFQWHDEFRLFFVFKIDYTRTTRQGDNVKNVSLSGCQICTSTWMDGWLNPMVEFIIVKLEFRNLLRRENCNNSVFKNHPCSSKRKNVRI